MSLVLTLGDFLPARLLCPMTTEYVFHFDLRLEVADPCTGHAQYVIPGFESNFSIPSSISHGDCRSSPTFFQCKVDPKKWNLVNKTPYLGPV